MTVGTNTWKVGYGLGPITRKRYVEIKNGKKIWKQKEKCILNKNNFIRLSLNMTELEAIKINPPHPLHTSEFKFDKKRNFRIQSI